MHGFPVDDERELIRIPVPKSRCATFAFGTSCWLKKHMITDLYQLLDIASGLECLHAMQPTVVHGDLKSVSLPELRKSYVDVHRMHTAEHLRHRFRTGMSRRLWPRYRSRYAGVRSHDRPRYLRYRGIHGTRAHVSLGGPGRCDAPLPARSTTMRYLCLWLYHVRGDSKHDHRRGRDGDD